MLFFIVWYSMLLWTFHAFCHTYKEGGKGSTCFRCNFGTVCSALPVALPKLFPSFDDYCREELGILLLLPNYREFRKQLCCFYGGGSSPGFHTSMAFWLKKRERAFAFFQPRLRPPFPLSSDYSFQEKSAEADSNLYLCTWKKSITKTCFWSTCSF